MKNLASKINFSGSRNIYEIICRLYVKLWREYSRKDHLFSKFGINVSFFGNSAHGVFE